MPNQLMTPELNRVSVWTTKIHHDNLSVATYNAYNYQENGIVKTSNKGNPIIRYVKNYKNFCLIIISHEKDTKKMEKFLDQTAKKVKKPKTNLTTTEFYYVAS